MLDVALGRLPLTMLVVLAGLVLVILGTEPRRPAFVVAGYTVVAVYVFLTALATAFLISSGAPR